MSPQQWYMAKNGHQIGPMSEGEIIGNVHNGSADGTTLVFTAGMSNWTALAQVPQLAAHISGGHQPTPPPGAAGAQGSRDRLHHRRH